VRRGDNVVLPTPHRTGRAGAPQLPWLLSRAVDRLPAGVSP
jgi:hypothetical protein